MSLLSCVFVAFAPTGAFSEKAPDVDVTLRGSHAIAKAIAVVDVGRFDTRKTFDDMWAVDASKPANPEHRPPMPNPVRVPVSFAYADTSDPTSAPFDAVFANPSAIGVILNGDLGKISSSTLLALGANSDAQVKCLADAIYFEARGESRQGQIAVAQVVLNRVKSRAFPNSVCGVVYQDQNMRHRCQFSFACDGIKDRIVDRGAWSRAVALAKEIVANGSRIFIADVGNATNYHATYVKPAWARNMRRMDTIGRHVFYAPYGGRSRS